MSSYEQISPEELTRIRSAADQPKARPDTILRGFVAVEGNQRCCICNSKMYAAYDSAEGDVCVDCATVRLVRALFTMIPLVSLAPPPPQPPQVWPLPPTEESLKLAGAQNTEYDLKGNLIVTLREGHKVNPMDLPSGTLLRFGPMRPSGDPDIRHTSGEDSPWDVGLVRRPDDPQVGPAIARPWRPDSPETIPTVEAPQEAYPIHTIDPAFVPEKKPTNFEEMKRYEAAHGDPVIMAMLEEEDLEWERKMREEIGDEAFEKLYGNKGRVQRVDGVGVVRTRDPKAGAQPTECEAYRGSPASFPSLANRSLL